MPPLLCDPGKPKEDEQRETEIKRPAARLGEATHLPNPRPVAHSAHNRKERENAESDEEAAPRRAERTAWLEHERKHHDGSDVRDCHLRHDRERIRIAEQPLFL